MPTPSPSDDAPSRRRGSILKVADASSADDGSIDAMPAKCSHRRRVSFTSVDIAEHELTLGDHPDCSYGPPTALSWTPRRRHSLDLEDFEAIRCPLTGEYPRARNRRRLIISSYKRREIIQDKGYTNEEIRQATVEKERTKTKRNRTRQYAGTPLWRVEHAVTSAARKLKKVISIGSTSKKTKRPSDPTTAAPGSQHDNDFENTDDKTCQTKTLSLSVMKERPKLTVSSPQMKKVASASA